MPPRGLSAAAAFLWRPVKRAACEIWSVRSSSHVLVCDTVPAGGAREVVKLFALTLVFSLPLGLAVTFGSMSKCRPVSWFF